MAELSLAERYKQRVKLAKETGKNIVKHSSVQSESAENSNAISNQKKEGCGCGRQK